MSEVEENSNGSRSGAGIKLFGATISVHHPIHGQDNVSKSEQQQQQPRPDKIIPCPRCHSLDTKFCYFNNYNVNQPRHFCKSCHRYWTAGGALRNVPVGAGRRKAKPPNPSQIQHLDFVDAAWEDHAVGFRPFFSGKRRRAAALASDGQTC